MELDFEVNMSGERPKYTFDITRIIDDKAGVKDNEERTYAKLESICGKIFAFSIILRGETVGYIKFINNLFYRYEQINKKYPFNEDYIKYLNDTYPGIEYTITEFNKIRLIDNIMHYNKNAKYEVCRFIADFVYCASNDAKSIDSIYNTFMNGYCYYFAVMLKEAFNRGEICWCAPYGHFVWMDTDGVPYDIYGVNHDDCDYYIPVSYIGDGVNDFKHVIGKVFNADEKFIKDCIEKYKKDKGEINYVSKKN